MTTRIDDETLVAFVDGELDEAEARRVEAAIAADRNLQETVLALHRGAAMLRAALNEPLMTPVPDHLVQTVESAFAGRAEAAARPSEAGRPMAPRRRFTVPVAASIAAVLIGLSGAFFIADYQVERRIARLEAYRAADRDLIEATIARALEEHLSGALVTWQNPDSGSWGRVEPIRTFRSSHGQWCREYVYVVERALGERRKEAHRAIACRDLDGYWKTRLQLGADS